AELDPLGEVLRDLVDPRARGSGDSVVETHVRTHLCSHVRNAVAHRAGADHGDGSYLFERNHRARTYSRLGPCEKLCWRACCSAAASRMATTRCPRPTRPTCRVMSMLRSSMPAPTRRRRPSASAAVCSS